MGEAKRRDAAGRKRTIPFSTIAEAWAITAATIIPEAAGETQRNDLRTAFYLGAGSFFDVLVHFLDDGDEPTEADMRRLDALYAELVAFKQQAIAKGLGAGMPPGQRPN